MPQNQENENLIKKSLVNFWLWFRILFCPHMYRYIALFHAGCGMGSESFETHRCSICGIYKEGVRGREGHHEDLSMVQHHAYDPTPRTGGQPIWNGEGKLQKPGMPWLLIIVIILISLGVVWSYYPLITMGALWFLGVIVGMFTNE